MANKEKFGIDLANKIFNYLFHYNEISFNHYGYCGVGFVRNGESILYTHFDEWLTYRNGNVYIPGGEYIGIIHTFNSKDDFTSWLAGESDYSLSGIESGDPWYTGNQRITRYRLNTLLNSK